MKIIYFVLTLFYICSADCDCDNDCFTFNKPSLNLSLGGSDHKWFNYTKIYM